MDDTIEIIARFDSEDTAEGVAKVMNAWFQWLMEGDLDDMPELFEDFGLSTEDYAFDRDTELDWDDTPRAYASGATVQVTLSSEGGESVGIVGEVLEALGAYEVTDGEEDDEEAA